MKFTHFGYLLFFAFIVIFCTPSNKEESSKPQEKFDLELSDPEAVKIARQVLIAVGGKTAWENTKYISWNFVGDNLVWDKTNNRVRIDWSTGEVALFDLENQKGEFYTVQKKLILAKDKSTWIDKAYKTWVNHSYWLFFPFKLMDPGVRLEYAGVDTTTLSEVSDKIVLTFDQVGITPQNKYEVWVNRSENLIKYWAYFKKKTDEEATLNNTWSNYKKYGEILLSDDRGEYKIEKILTFDDLPEEVFRKVDKPKFLLSEPMN